MEDDPMAVHRFQSSAEIAHALEDGGFPDGDILVYTMHHIGPGTGGDHYLVCANDGRLMATCGWHFDAGKIAEALSDD